MAFAFGLADKRWSWIELIVRNKMHQSRLMSIFILPFMVISIVSLC